MAESTDLIKLLRYYKGKRVLITGHTGFKGSWLSIWLHKLGAITAGYSLPPYTEKDNYLLSKVDNCIISYIGDIRDYDNLAKVFSEFKPEIIFHLAAQTRVIDGYNDPKYTYDVNIGGVVNLLECCRKFDCVKTIVVVTSDKCYENKGWIWPYRENDLLGGFDPYSSSKAGVEIVCASYRNSFFNTSEYQNAGKCLSTARAGNVIGGGDWTSNQLIPDCIRAIEMNEIINIRNPRHTRPWQFVLEPLWGYLLLGIKMSLDPNSFSSEWNFGPRITSVITVEKIVELVIKNYDKGEWEYQNTHEFKHEAEILSLDHSKAFFKLGWQPTMEIEEAITLTVDWYLNYQVKKKNMFEFCSNQIDLFTERVKYQIII